MVQSPELVSTERNMKRWKKRNDRTFSAALRDRCLPLAAIWRKQWVNEISLGGISVYSIMSTTRSIDSYSHSWFLIPCSVHFAAADNLTSATSDDFAPSHHNKHPMGCEAQLAWKCLFTSTGPLFGRATATPK